MSTSPFSVKLEVTGFINYVGRLQKISARHRIEIYPELMPYKELLLSYDWTEEDHYKWVDNAPIDEILEWCKGVENVLS